MSKFSLLEKLADKFYRDAFVSDEIDVGLPMQIRSMREARGWKQGDVAEKMGTKQPRFSLMERPGYGNFSINTLKRLASLFDVGLVVSFVPWSEMIDFVESLSRKRLAAAGFQDEYPRLYKAYSKERIAPLNTVQAAFDFSGASSRETSISVPATETKYQMAGKTMVEISEELLCTAHLGSMQLEGSGYVRTSF